MTEQKKGLLIFDYGSQYTLLIARKLRELGIYTEVVAPEAKTSSDFVVKGYILSGGPGNVSSVKNGPSLPEGVLESGLPVLGICYGMQLLAESFGGKVQAGVQREYGRSELTLNEALSPMGARLLNGLPQKHSVWMSHGDDVLKMPIGFSELARTESGVLAAVAHDEKAYFGLQFHPEVKHSKYGMPLLANFARSICSLEASWSGKAMLDLVAEQIKAQNKEGDRILLGVSGGVDSLVTAVLLKRFLPESSLQCVMVDNGLLRKGERKEVESYFESLDINLAVLDCQDYFLSRLADISDPEEKRKIIGRSFIECFENFAKENGPFTHLGQGTLYPDVIESAGHGKGAHVIKSHHNVGGLPAVLKLKLIEPLRFLFKDEVRRLGRELSIESKMLNRHPFPGPGLAIRIPGAVTRDKLAVLREADFIFTAALREEGHYARTWQAATILLPVKSVGVMGDQRSYENCCVLRAVESNDGMTADVVDLPMAFLTRVASKIVNKVSGINRVLYDVTSKPPATIEWE